MRLEGTVFDYEEDGYAGSRYIDIPYDSLDMGDRESYTHDSTFNPRSLEAGVPDASIRLMDCLELDVSVEDWLRDLIKTSGIGQRTRLPDDDAYLIRTLKDISHNKVYQQTILGLQDEEYLFIQEDEVGWYAIVL